MDMADWIITQRAIGDCVDYRSTHKTMRGGCDRGFVFLVWVNGLCLWQLRALRFCVDKGTEITGVTVPAPSGSPWPTSVVALWDTILLRSQYVLPVMS